MVRLHPYHTQENPADKCGIMYEQHNRSDEPVGAERVLYPERLLVKVGGRVAFVRTGEIAWIEAQGNYVKLHNNGQSYLIRKTMREMESLLDPRTFFRIHRSTIVNGECIRELSPLIHGDYGVTLTDGTRLVLSRNHVEKLKRAMERLWLNNTEKPLRPAPSSK